MIVFGQHRDLVTPAVPCFREAMEKKNWRPLAGFDSMHPDAVDLGRMVSNVHEQELYFSSSPATRRNSFSTDGRVGSFSSSNSLFTRFAVEEWRSLL